MTVEQNPFPSGAAGAAAALGRHMHAHAEPIVWTVRVFDSPIGLDGSTGYDRGEADRIVTVCTALKINRAGDARINGLFGRFGLDHMNALTREARRWGFRTLHYERHGRERVMVVR